MKKTLKTIGLFLLLLSMLYASNWDIPKQDEPKAEMPPQIVHRIVTKDGDILESPYFTSEFIRENHVEPLEAKSGVIETEKEKTNDE